MENQWMQIAGAVEHATFNISAGYKPAEIVTRNSLLRE
jgi:hypothetical protein